MFLVKIQWGLILEFIPTPLCETAKLRVLCKIDKKYDESEYECSKFILK